LVPLHILGTQPNFVLNKMIGGFMVLLLLDFSQPFDMVVHELLLCKLRNAQNYSVGATILVGSYLAERVQFVRSGGQESFVGAVTCWFLRICSVCVNERLRIFLS
jgi:hypothetical protein